MKRKKLLSTAVAGMLVAAQMVMPVMAADGGKVDVDIDTTNVVIRVKVPTSLAVSVNQFEKNDAGSQITSESFTIENMSEIPVWVTVDSKLTMDSGVTLKDKRNDAKNSTVTTTGEAWVGVVAQATSTVGDYVGAADKTIADLNEDSQNVDVLKKDAAETGNIAKASQEFYLSKPGSTAVVNKSFKPAEDGKAKGIETDGDTSTKDVGYARFYELTELTITNAGTSEQADLDNALKAGDVYSMTATDGGKSGITMTLIKKGAAATYDATNATQYYTVATTVTTEANLKANEFYVYATDAAGGKTAFRYIGSLSDTKATWTDTDFTDMEIKYDIKGLTDTKYTNAASSLINGYKKKTPAVVDAAPSITTTTYSYDRTATLDIPISLGSGTLKATAVTTVGSTTDGTTLSADYTADCTITDNKVTIPTGKFPGANVGDTKKLLIIFNDTASTKIVVTVNVTQ